LFVVQYGVRPYIGSLPVCSGASRAWRPTRPVSRRDIADTDLRDRIRAWSGSVGLKGRGAALDDASRIDALQETYAAMRRQIGKVIIGQERVIEEMLIALFSGGHVLLEGVPGLAKTLLISTLAKVMDLTFNRIQFTPDLMPSDITGSEILEEDPATRRRAFKFVRGPVFANVVLADEINRTPPKTQAALLQAMQEQQVTAGGQTHELQSPFFVLATQNPIEQEGTYPLPEAQLDRFMFNVLIGYPALSEEITIVESTTAGAGSEPQKVLDRQEVLAYQDLVQRVPLAENVTRYAVNLVRASRVGTGEEIAPAREYLAWGAGPRAAQFLIRGAKTRALLHGRPTCDLDDVKRLALPVMRHRLVTNFHAEAEEISKDRIVEMILAEVAS
jgi:MoxR-like ATPase